MDEPFHAVYLRTASGSGPFRLNAIFLHPTAAEEEAESLVDDNTEVRVVAHHDLAAIPLTLKPDIVDPSVKELVILLPRLDSHAARAIPPRSGIIAAAQDIQDGFWLVHWEDHAWRGRCAGTWADRVAHAARRRRHCLTSISLGRFHDSDLHIIGRLGGDNRIQIQDEKALANYLGYGDAVPRHELAFSEATERRLAEA